MFGLSNGKEPVKVRFRVFGEDDLPRTYTMDYIHGEIEFKANEDAYYDILPGRHRFAMLFQDRIMVTYGKITADTVCLVILKGDQTGIFFTDPKNAARVWE